MLHEFWLGGDELGTVCLAGPMGDDARATLDPGAELVWTFEAASHFEAMTLYYQHRGWGEYTTDYPEIDTRTYADLGGE